MLKVISEGEVDFVSDHIENDSFYMVTLVTLDEWTDKEGKPYGVKNRVSVHLRNPILIKRAKAVKIGDYIRIEGRARVGRKNGVNKQGQRATYINVVVDADTFKKVRTTSTTARLAPNLESKMVAQQQAREAGIQKFY